MLNYSNLESENAMDSCLRHHDVPVAEAAMMRYVDVAVIYLKATYSGMELKEKLDELRQEIYYVFDENNLNGQVASETYSHIIREIEEV